ncbi:AraC family transcriptional regulator [Actinoplanes sp. NPDC023714]|uniref:AraC family transcriptional regulator n=1 Tax=Actinoplanes sp. NPDC023714 TaxID=3154322 RepID=UPI0033DC0619
MIPKAYSFVRTFAPEPAREMLTDRHYLLCASAGALRLEANGQSWVLPPARAALIAAGRPIRVSIPQPVTTSSVLFDPMFAPVPPTPLTVFDLNPLARALLAECGSWGDSSDPYASALFDALIAVTWRLAERPSPVVVPAGSSPELRRALALTEERLGGEVRFEDIAAEVGLVPRSLARRFEDETGMTWRAVLRRMRILRAIEELAAGDASVTAVAFAVGYTSLSGFNAAFRELTGRTPSEYRASFRP